MWNGINRRKFPRAHYKCLIYIKKYGHHKPISTYTENIGAGGICVILKEDLGLFQGVDLEIELENGIKERVKCKGTVVWVVKRRDIRDRKSVEYDTGIEFVDINDDNRDRIVKIVEKSFEKENL